MKNNHLERYLNYIDIYLGYSPETKKNYGIILSDFVDFLSQNKVKLRKIKKDYIGEYILHLRDKKKNCSRTIRTKVEVIKSFISYLKKNIPEFRKNSIDLSGFKYKVEKKDALSLSDDEVEILIKTVEKELEVTEETFNCAEGKKKLLEKQVLAAKRDFVLVKLLIATGLRISEALNIKISHIDFNDKSIMILGKGKKYRQFFYDLENLEKDFLYYIDKWKNLKTNNDFIFVSIKCYNQLTPRGFQLLLKKYIKKAGLNSLITPHSLRHTFATLSIEGGANIKAVSQILGHSNCKITIDLYTHLSNKHVREVMQKCNPLSNTIISLEEKINGRKKHLAYLDRTG